jgi:uncharacterized protein (TIGR02996 family)
MNDDCRSLLAAVLDHPDDDAPRLRYADWLADNGDPCRAEFIRVQCQLAEGALSPECAEALREREEKLLKENEARWLPFAPGSPSADDMPRTCWLRGFVRSLVSYRWDAEGLVRVFKEHPVQYLWLSLDSHDQDMPQQLLNLAVFSTFDQLKGLEIFTEKYPAGEVFRHLRSVLPDGVSLHWLARNDSDVAFLLELL